MPRDDGTTEGDGTVHAHPLETIVNWSTGHPWRTLGVFLAITLVAMVPASQLTVDSSVEGFFGEDMPEEVEHWMDITEEFGEQEIVTVVVDCSASDGRTAQSYLQDLAGALEGNTDYRDLRFTQDLDFAGEHAILYLPEETLYFLLDPNATVESVNATYWLIMSSMEEPKYIVSEDGEVYLMNMVINRTIDSAESRAEVIEGLKDALYQVQDGNSSYSRLQVGYTGGMTVMDYEGDQMAMTDMAISLVLTFVLIVVLLFLSFRSLSLPLLALVPLLLGIVMTAGLVYIAYGSLNLLSVIFSVLLLGLGVDFSIHILTRFLEEVEVDGDIQAAFSRTSVNTGRAVVLGAITTATAFTALALSKSTALHQMGIVLAAGLVLTMVCVLFVLPALVTLRLRRGKLREKLHRRTRYQLLGRVGAASARYAAAVIVVIALVGALFVVKAPDAEMNADIHELQPTSIDAYRQLQKVKEHFNYSEEYILAVASSWEELTSTVEGFRDVPDVMSVESVLDFLPQDQPSKLAIIAQARELHPEFAHLDWLDIDEMTWEELPEDITTGWVSNGDGGDFLVRVKVEGNIWEEGYRKSIVPQLREVNSDLSATAMIWPTLVDTMTGDVMTVSLLAGAPIFVILYLGFRRRNPVHAVLALVPVLVGVGGVLALSEYLGISLNMVSMMLIPLVIGIGIDDGIHVLHRYKEEGRGSIPRVIQNTGKAIFLTTATTCLAFSSFLVADHPGLRSLGQVPVLGLALAFVAAVLFLPALIRPVLERGGDGAPGVSGGTPSRSYGVTGDRQGEDPSG